LKQKGLAIEHENERSLSIQDIEMRCPSMSSTKNNSSEDDTGLLLGIQTKLLLTRCNDSLLLLYDAEAAGGSREKNLRGHSDARLRRHARNRSAELTLISVVEDNEDIKEGSLGSMCLEAEGIDYNDEHENERSLSIQDIEMRSKSLSESRQRLQQSNVTATSQAATV
jgi:hypothetical protein